MASFASFQTEIEQYSKQSKAAQQQQQAPQSPIKKVQRHQVKPAIPVPSLATKENEHALPKQGPPIEDSDDGRTILERLLHPNESSTSSLASLLHGQIEHARGELLLCLSSHNLNERSLASLLDTRDAASPTAHTSLPLLAQADVDQAFQSIKAACSEVSLYASILWNPFDTHNIAEEESMAKYAPATSANDDDTLRKWDAKESLHILVRAKPHTAEELLELRVAVVGNVDAGKSTLLGVMTKGRLDDGRGRARVALFRHKHEIETGRTSSVGMEILGFDPSGREVMSDVVPGTSGPTPAIKDGKATTVSTSVPSTVNAAARRRDLSWDEICKEAAKVVGFIDLAGHEKYFKTTIGALSSCSPDFVLLIVGANAGIVGMSKEHLSVSLALNVPIVCVVTKIDSTPANVLDSTLKQLAKILRSPGCRKSPVFVKNRGMACSLAKGFVSQKAAPIFLVSNVNGEGLEPLKCFLNALNPAPQGKFDASAPLELSISDVFSVPFVGCVVSGVLLSGTVKAGDPVLIGPDSLGAFIPTSIRSIERKRVRVAGAEAGQSVALALKRIRRNQVRKGMVLLSHDATPKAVQRFTASVLILYHNSTIARGYQAMAHIGSIRQTVKIVDIDRPFVRTGDRCQVVMEFIKSPEYCRPGSRILFREGKTKGLGVITSMDAELFKPANGQPSAA